eukprot:XP_764560.1 hypothetical protein [Theileria parva strain Muguga]
MNKFTTYLYIFIIIGCIKCSDKPGDKSGDKSSGLVPYSDSEEDNFDVTESSVKTTEPAEEEPLEEEPDRDKPGHVEEGREKYVKQVSEPYKKDGKCEIIRFFKKNNEGVLVEMTGRDYTVSFSDKKIVKYGFKEDLELVLCNGETAYKHVPGKVYYSSLTYYRNTNTLIIVGGGEFLRIIYNKGKWRASSRRSPTIPEFYTKNSKGTYLLLSSEYYTFDITPTGSFKYIFISGVKCSKIILNKLLVWKKTDEPEYPTSIIITLRLNVFIFFRGYRVLFGKTAGKYRRIGK